MKKINWGQSYTRKYSIHKLDIYLLHMDRELRKFFPKGMKNLLAFGRGFDVRWHQDDNEFKRLGEMVLEKTLSDAMSGKNHIRKMIIYAANAIRKISNFDRINFRKQNSKELERHLNKYFQALDSSIPIIYAPLVTDLGLLEYTEKLLAKIYSNFHEKLEIIITPIKPIPVLQLELEFLKILIKKMSKATLRKELELIHKKYYWLGMRFIDNKPMAVDYFIEQLNNLKKINYQSRLLNYKNDLKRRKIDFDKVLQPFTITERKFLKLVNEYSVLRHSRDIYRNAAHYYGYFIYQEIRRRFKISLKDLLTYGVDELKVFIRHNKKIDKKEVENRKKHFLYLLVNNKRMIISQQQKIKKVFDYQLGGQSKDKKTEKIIGQGAYAGKIKGKVKIIHLNTLSQDLKNFKDGEIMVAESTKPDYVTAMKRARAIITNEGGITCHAAIISRELKIPCVIGTKIATKVFKDGDLVEVDAENGIVRKI